VIDARPAGTNSVKFAKSTSGKAPLSATEANWFENMFTTNYEGKKTNRCDITSCEVRNSGCKTAYSGNKVTVTNPKLDRKGEKVKDTAKIIFDAMTTVNDGWTETVCVACSNAGKGTVYKDGWVVKQN